MRLKKPKASTEIVDGSNCGMSYGSFSWPRQASTVCSMRNAIPRVRVRVKSPLRSVELSKQPLADRMRAKMAMPGRFIGVPELRAMEGEQFFAGIIEREQSIGPLKRHAWGIQDVVELKLIPSISFKLLRDDPAFEYLVQDRASSVASSGR